MSTDEKPTVEIPAVPLWAVELSKVVNGMATSVSTLVEDGKGMNLRVAGIEGRLARLESPTNPPPAPLTTDRVHALIDEHPSQLNLEIQARQAEQIIKDAERDRKIAETHDLASKAATKDDVAALSAGTATKAEVKELVETANKAQVSAIVEGVKGLQKLAEKSPTVRGLLMALAALALVLITAATNYVTTRAAQPPAPTSTSITVTK